MYYFRKNNNPAFNHELSIFNHPNILFHINVSSVDIHTNKAPLTWYCGEILLTEYCNFIEELNSVV